jgi:2-polyprenyl-3-methyl-5-hydroxy-6-metoxy-1,4-benzoquinol methylase
MKKQDSVKCDVCGKKEYTVFLEVGKHCYNRCKNCKTIVLATRDLNNHNPETYLDDPEQYLGIVNPHGTRYLAGCVDHAFEAKVSHSKGKLLEIGSGLGFLSYTLFSRGWEVEQLELSKAAADWSSKVFKLPVDTRMIEDYKPKSKYDAVVMVEVIEHFYDPSKALKKIHKNIRRGGMLFGTTPNIDSEHWLKTEQNIYEPSDHIVLFNTKSLIKILKDNGFKNITIEPFGVGDKHDSNLMYSATR